MYINYYQIKNRKETIERELQKVTRSLLNMPDGELMCAKNGKGYKWYKKTGTGEKIYLLKSEINLAKKLAMKKYLLAKQKDLINELRACEKYLRAFHGCLTNEDLLLQNTEYSRLLNQESFDLETLKWMNEEYERNTNYPENLNVEATQGKMVRSKSEAIIDKLLFLNKIPFRYEAELKLGWSTIFPDFTIMHPVTKELFYWEHFGMMDNIEYVNKVTAKIRLYCENGIIPDQKLIMTFESKNCPLSISKIENIIKEKFC